MIILQHCWICETKNREYYNFYDTEEFIDEIDENGTINGWSYIDYEQNDWIEIGEF